MGSILIEYKFTFPDETNHHFVIDFDEFDLRYKTKNIHPIPEWTRLENQQCSHCPLKKEETPYCPVALNIESLVEFFKDKISYEKASITVTTVERIYSKTVNLEEGIFSIFGLIMPLSDCPHTNFLKPMARFHLPFASSQETIVRSVSLYLLKQYFIKKHGGVPDLELKKLHQNYENIKKLNLGIINRIRTIAKKDAELNALIVLDAFAQLLTFSISEDLQAIEIMFNAIDKNQSNTP